MTSVGYKTCDVTFSLLKGIDKMGFATYFCNKKDFVVVFLEVD